MTTTDRQHDSETDERSQGLNRASPVLRVWCATMCHEFSGRSWDSVDERETEDDEETPEFLNETGSDDIEVLTDGGE